MRSDGTKAIEEAVSVGGLVLPALIAIAYAIYLLITVGIDTTNGWVLLVLGLATLIASAPRNSRIALLPAFALGAYQMLVIGLAALGIALSEGSSWSTVAIAIFWTAIGWRCLAKAGERKRELDARK